MAKSLDLRVHSVLSSVVTSVLQTCQFLPSSSQKVIIAYLTTVCSLAVKSLGLGSLRDMERLKLKALSLLFFHQPLISNYWGFFSRNLSLNLHVAADHIPPIP